MDMTSSWVTPDRRHLATGLRPERVEVLAYGGPVGCGAERGLPHLPQPAKMRGQRRSESLMRLIPQTKLPTRLRHQRRQHRVMEVTDPRKQVVLDLEVQPADEPAKQPVPVGKIHSCFDLMHCPGGFHPSGVWPGQRKSRVLHTMPQLKYHAKHLALHERRYHPKQKHDPDRVQRQGDREC